MGLRERFTDLAIDVAGAPTWVEGTSSFWYRKSVVGGSEFMLVDASAAEKTPAFDHARLAVVLSAALDDEYTAVTLPFGRIEFVDGTNAIDIEMEIDGTIWRCDLAVYECESTGRQGGGRGGRGGGRGARNEEPRRSPDDRWEALINNYNVVVRETGGDELIRLSMDGSEGEAYELSSIVWSPDSSKLAAYRVKPGYRREIHYVESSPEDQLQPKYTSRVYAKPGDSLDKDIPVVFDAKAERAFERVGPQADQLVLIVDVPVVVRSAAEGAHERIRSTNAGYRA